MKEGFINKTAGMLGKADPKELWREVVSYISDDVLLKPDVKILVPGCGYATEALALANRMYKLGVPKDEIKYKFYLLDKYKSPTETLKLWGWPNVIQDDFLTWQTTMKFDIVITNPPYQDKKGNEKSTNSADLYTKFIEKSLTLSKNYVVMVVPSAWSGPKPSRLKSLIFEQHQPIVFNTHGKEWFDVEMSTCYFVTQINRKGETVLSDNNNNSIVRTLTKDSVIGVNLKHLELKEKFEQFSKKANLAGNWLRGKIHLNETESVARKDGVELITSVGNRNAPVNVEKIDPSAETTGYGINKLVIPNMGSGNNLGNIKFATKEQVGGHSVVFLTGDNDRECINMKSYLETKAIKFLIRATKISTPNSKATFRNIPKVDFTKNWSDEELYNYFGFTQDEIKYIEDNT